MGNIKTLYKNNVNTLKNFRYLLSFAWLDGKHIILLNILYAILGGIFPILSLQVSKALMDLLVGKINNTNDIQFLSYRVILLLIFTALINIFKIVFEYIKDFVFSLNRRSIEINMEMKILKKLKLVDMEFFDNPDFNDLYTKVRSGINTNPSELFNGIFSLLQDIITFISYVVSLNSIVTINKFIKLSLILVSLIASIYRKILMVKQNKLEQKQFEDVNLEQRQSKYFSELFLEPTFQDEFRIYNASDYYINKIETLNNNIYIKLKKSKYKIHNYNRLGAVGAELIRKIPYIGIVYMTYINKITYGEFVLLTGILEGMFTVLFGFNQAYKSLINNLYYVTYLREFLNMDLKILDNQGNKMNIKLNGGSHTIEFKNVYFKYSGMSKYILENVSFKINANEIVAIAGVNGSGKTTIIKLLLRLYEINNGSILIDDIDIKEYNTESLYYSFGVLFQDFCRYSLTIAETINLGDLKNVYNSDKLQDALIKSDMFDYVNSLPNKENTLLSRSFSGESIDLSTGQWQKLSIARAFYGNKEILILDEPTASLDIETEAKVVMDLKNIKGTKTIIFVSHNLSSLKICDKVIYLENGKTQVGNHEFLLNNNKSYSELYYSQADRFSYF